MDMCDYLWAGAYCTKPVSVESGFQSENGAFPSGSSHGLRHSIGHKKSPVSFSDTGLCVGFAMQAQVSTAQ
jgi:hypothetical protein